MAKGCELPEARLNFTVVRNVGAAIVPGARKKWVKPDIVRVQFLGNAWN
jgi:hypothetical protein